MEPEGVKLASAGLRCTLPVWAIRSSSVCHMAPARSNNRYRLAHAQMRWKIQKRQECTQKAVLARLFNECDRLLQQEVGPANHTFTL